jgi:hypothetical protein
MKVRDLNPGDRVLVPYIMADADGCLVVEEIPFTVKSRESLRNGRYRLTWAEDGNDSVVHNGGVEFRMASEEGAT